MQRTRKISRYLVPIFPRVIGSFFLCVYLATATPLLAALTALAGSVDRSHHVALQQTAQGVQVVLRHECKLLAHRHGVVARALTLLAQRPMTGHPDHVIQFSASSISEPTPVFTVEQTSQLVTVDTLPLSDSRPYWTRMTVLSSAHARPPDKGASQLSVCSTVLLI